ncbi:hypothetical protein FTO74_18495 [Granulicella sp. WH15]|uniref:hypothetical protein n=1 Tax=Granulicella sp. WH15 TaxID=2602070 RepID=UPI0013679251|nr:hypothetical protein [Granulicella sp. WH15]QHN05631.1 hypothetical protein FTO74_18495 [Granulicella sp. WH15]
MQILEPLPKSATGLDTPSSNTGVSDVHAHADDPRWQLARRIAASGSLGRSRLLADFLLYVVDRHIRDRTDEITEQQIGILVFGRAEGYDANDDNIVRSYARNLRKRIDEYFALEGKDEPLRLEIPRGGYAPSFSTQAVAVQPAHDNRITPQLGSSADATLNTSPQHSEESLKPRPLNPLSDASISIPTTRWYAVGTATLRKYGVVLSLCIGLVLGASYKVLRPLPFLKRAFPSPSEAASATLWSQLFSNDRDTFIVPSDDGLVIMQRLTERPVPLTSYVNGSYRANIKTDGDPGAPEILKLGARRYTSVVDLDFVAHLAQLDEVVPARMMVRYARDLRMEDLRSSNAILIGSTEANPWIELFQPHMPLRFSFHAGKDQPSGIVNMHPRSGEKDIYGTPDPSHTYGLIAYLPNLTSTGHVLIVGGLNTAGTEAATTFLLTPSLMMPTLQRAKAAHGGLQPFVLLVGAANVAANASAPQVILERIGPS